MPRPTKCRRVCEIPSERGFLPAGSSAGRAQTILLGVDEYEAIRLIDLEGFTQEQCAAQMGIARTTVTGIYEAARHKLAQALVGRKRLLVSGGEVAVCGNRSEGCSTRCCHRQGCHGGCGAALPVENKQSEEKDG